MRGISQSLTTTSAPRELYRSSASAPFLAQLGAWPRSVTTLWTSERTLGSSSAMRIWMVGPPYSYLRTAAHVPPTCAEARVAPNGERLFYAVAFSYGSAGVRGC